MPILSIVNQNLDSMKKTWIFEHFREVQMINNQLIDFDLVMKHLSGDLLRAALYRVMLVLHKHALFHFVGVKWESLQNRIGKKTCWITHGGGETIEAINN